MDPIVDICATFNQISTKRSWKRTLRKCTREEPVEQKGYTVKNIQRMRNRHQCKVANKAAEDTYQYEMGVESTEETDEGSTVKNEQNSSGELSDGTDGYQTDDELALLANELDKDDCDNNLTGKTESEIRLLTSQRKGIPNLFISDILKAKRFSDKYTNNNSTYTVKNLIFESVMIRGVIVGIEIRERIKYFVDDGTAAICCYFHNSLKESKEELENFLKRRVETYNPKNKSHLISFSLLHEVQYKLNEYAQTDFEHGQTVIVIGNVSIYQNRGYIFAYEVHKVKSTDVEDDIEYYKYVNGLYKNTYPIIKNK